MGYTNYWTRSNKPITKEFLHDVIDIIYDSEKKGINLCGSFGKGLPTISKNVIALNGDIKKNEDCESFVINNDFGEWYFCKTREKPYNYTVQEILKSALKHGIITEWGHD